MAIAFNKSLAEGLERFNTEIRNKSIPGFDRDPTAAAKSFLKDHHVEVPDPETFHVHVIKANEPLPQEPARATIDRYIYVYRESGLFEFKLVPGSPDGDDDMMKNPTGACACCNCCVLVF